MLKLNIKLFIASADYVNKCAPYISKFLELNSEILLITVALNQQQAFRVESHKWLIWHIPKGVVWAQNGRPSRWFYVYTSISTSFWKLTSQIVPNVYIEMGWSTTLLKCNKILMSSSLAFSQASVYLGIMCYFNISKKHSLVS